MVHRDEKQERIPRKTTSQKKQENQRKETLNKDLVKEEVLDQIWEMKITEEEFFHEIEVGFEQSESIKPKM